jgi:hypothetical protein
LGQTARRPAIFNVSSNTQRYVVPLFVVAGAFVLGWWMGRDGSDVAQPPAGPASAGPPSAGPSAVKLVLDAGGVTLLPEGGLELRPITPLDADAEPGTEE